MKIEHVAFNVSDPGAVARWYVERLGFVVTRQLVESPFTHFLADDGGGVMVELYHNPRAAVPAYAEQDPMILHLALVSDDVAADRQRLLAAGATAIGEVEHLENGDVLAMLRDPWGLALQLASRHEPMIR